MKKLYKIISIMLVCLMLAGLLAGCKGKDESSVDVQTPVGTDNNPDATAAPEATEEPIVFTITGDYTLKEKNLFSNETFSAKIVSVDEAVDYIDFVFEFENKTDEAVIFSLSSIDTDAFVVSKGFDTVANAKDKASTSLRLDKAFLFSYKLLPVDILSFKIAIRNAANWSASPLFERGFTIYPTEKTLDQCYRPSRIACESEKIVVDSERCSFVVLKPVDDDIFTDSFNALVYVENKGKTPLVFLIDQCFVNGNEIDMGWTLELAPGAKTYKNISVYADELELFGATKEDVSSLECHIIIYNPQDWSGPSLVNESFTYSVK